LIRAAINKNMGVNLQVTPYFKFQINPQAMPKPALNKLISSQLKREDLVPPIGRKLREHRLAKHLTQFDVAVFLGVSAAYISQIEAGKRLLMRRDLETLVRIYQLSKKDETEVRHLFDEDR
jgi:DNA-binding XRE family transcriptional regulator